MVKLMHEGPTIIRTKLNKLGYDLTDESVKAFQKKYGLVPDAIIGPLTEARINALIAVLNKPAITVPKVIPAKRKITGDLLKIEDVEIIVLHHVAGTMNWEQIDKLHIDKFGGNGFGYHFKIDEDGTIQAGRPLNVIGEQCKGLNSKSIGIVFNGNLEVKAPTAKQIESGKILVNWLKYKVFNKPKVIGHKEAHDITKAATITACPGKNFPLADFKKL